MDPHGSVGALGAPMGRQLDPMKNCTSERAVASERARAKIQDSFQNKLLLGVGGVLLPSVELPMGQYGSPNPEWALRPHWGAHTPRGPTGLPSR